MGGVSIEMQGKEWEALPFCSQLLKKRKGSLCAWEGRIYCRQDVRGKKIVVGDTDTLI